MPVVAVDNVVLRRAPEKLRRPLPPPRRPKRQVKTQVKTQVMAVVTPEDLVAEEPNGLEWSDDEDRTDLRAPHPGQPQWDSEPEPAIFGEADDASEHTASERTVSEQAAGEPSIEPSTHRVEVDLRAGDEPIPHTVAGPPPFSDHAPQTLRGIGFEPHDEPAHTKVSSQIPEQPFDLRATEVRERTPIADEDSSDAALASEQPDRDFDPRATDVLPNPYLDPNDSSPSIEIAVVMAADAPDSIPVSLDELDDPSQPSVDAKVDAQLDAQSLHPSYPPVALDSEPSAHVRVSRWNKVAGVSSLLALAAVAATLAIVLMPRTGSLEVTLAGQGATIPKAEVFVDGQKRCDTHPCRVAGLEPGMRSIKVLVPGVPEAVVQTVEVVAGETQSTRVSLPAAPSQGVRASASSAGVHLWIDGSDRGALPLTVGDLSVGSHKLRFESDARFEPIERTVDVKAGQLIDLGEVSLPIKQVRLTIDLQTPGARVVLMEIGGDSQEIEGPWPRAVDVAPGRYKLVASKAGFRAHAERLTVDTTKAERDVKIELSRGGNATASDQPRESSDAVKYGEGFDPYAE
jgi:serine/threonine-protein kinase